MHLHRSTGDTYITNTHKEIRQFFCFIWNKKNAFSWWVDVLYPQFTFSCWKDPKSHFSQLEYGNHSFLLEGSAMTIIGDEEHGFNTMTHEPRGRMFVIPPRHTNQKGRYSLQCCTTWGIVLSTTTEHRPGIEDCLVYRYNATGQVVNIYVNRRSRGTTT